MSEDIRKKVNDRLKELNVEEYIFDSVSWLENDEELSELLEKLKNGINDSEDIEDYITEIDKKYHPENYDDDDSGYEIIGDCE